LKSFLETGKALKSASCAAKNAAQETVA